MAVSITLSLCHNVASLMGDDVMQCGVNGLAGSNKLDNDSVMTFVSMKG